MKQKIRKQIIALLPTVLLVLGAVAVSFGVGMIYIPAGVISGGGWTLLGGVLLIKGGDGIE